MGTGSAWGVCAWGQVVHGRRCTIAMPNRRSSPYTSEWCGCVRLVWILRGCIHTCIDINPHLRSSPLILAPPQNAFLKALLNAVSAGARGAGAGAGTGTEAQTHRRRQTSDCTSDMSDGPPPAEGPSPSSVFHFRCKGQGCGTLSTLHFVASQRLSSPRCYNLGTGFLWCNREFGL